MLIRPEGSPGLAARLRRLPWTVPRPSARVTPRPLSPVIERFVRQINTIRLLQRLRVKHIAQIQLLCTPGTLV